MGYDVILASDRGPLRLSVGDRLAWITWPDGRREKLTIGEAAVLTAPVAKLWMPIGSAPRDGTEILVFDPDTSAPHIFRAAFCQADSDPVSGEADAGQWFDPSWAEVPAPTHWMPLPPPPEKQVKE